MQLSRLAAVVVLFLLSLALHWVREDAVLFPDDEAVSAAIGLTRTGTLSDPFQTANTGPTAHVSPAFPYGAALIISAVSGDRERAFALNLSANVAISLLAATLPLAAVYLGLDFVTGVLAAAFYLLADVPLFPQWEASYAALICLVVTGLVVRFMTKGRTVGLAVAIGLLCGIAVLTSASVAIVYAVWLLYNFRQVCLRKTLAPGYLALACLPLLMVAPWTLRNYRVFHRFVAIRDNIGLELQVSNNPCSTFSEDGNKLNWCFSQNHPNENLTEAIRVRTLGEVAYNDAKLKEAITWIEAHPQRFLSLDALRFVHFWFPTEAADLRSVLAVTGYREYSLVVFLMTMLSPVGLCFLYRTDRSLAVVFSFWLGLFPLIYYVIQYDQRYRIPILWITFLLGSHAIVRLARRLSLIPRITGQSDTRRKPL